MILKQLSEEKKKEEVIHFVEFLKLKERKEKKNNLSQHLRRKTLNMLSPLKPMLNGLVLTGKTDCTMHRIILTKCLNTPLS